MNRKQIRLKSVIVTILSVLLIFETVGCNNPKTINENDYPTPETVVTEPGEKPETVTITDNDELYKEALKPEPDSLKEEGKYSFNPCIISSRLLADYIDNPKVVLMAKAIMRAAYNMETEITFPASEFGEYTEDEFVQAVELAHNASLMMNSVDISTVDGENYNLEYFSSIVYTGKDDEGLFTFDTGDTLSEDEARAINTYVVDYITGMINDNLTAESSEADRVREVYKQLVRDFEVVEPDYSDYYFEETPEEGEELYRSGSVLMDIREKKLETYEFLSLFEFVLTQLHIDSYNVSSSGIFDKNYYEKYINDGRGISSWWDWLIVAMDGNYYHCDPLFEKRVFEKDHGKDSGADPEMLFFGMSDAKRKETFRYEKTSLTDNINFSSDVPECPNNLDL